MAIFRYQALDEHGKTQRGVQQADSARHARQLLREKGWLLLEIHAVAQATPGSPRSLLTRRTSASDLALLTRQLATLTRAGIPLLQALEVIANGFEHLAMRKLVRALQQDINAGISLASALRKNPAHFDALFCNLVDAGEQAGALDVVLQRVAAYKEKTEALKKKIQKAMNRSFRKCSEK